MWCFLLFMPTLSFHEFPVVLLKVKAETSADLYWAFRLINLHPLLSPNVCLLRKPQALYRRATRSTQPI